MLPTCMAQNPSFESFKLQGLFSTLDSTGREATKSQFSPEGSDLQNLCWTAFAVRYIIHMSVSQILKLVQDQKIFSSFLSLNHHLFILPLPLSSPFSNPTSSLTLQQKKSLYNMHCPVYLFLGIFGFEIKRINHSFKRESIC